MHSHKDHSLLILPGHAIYHNRKWEGLERGNFAGIEGHIADACRLCNMGSYTTLCVSGGRSRPDNTELKDVSEAEGITTYMREHEETLKCAGISPLLEQWARDSFENVLFALLAYREKYQEWPQQIGVVSWKYKALRFYIAALGLGITSRFTFQGSGDENNSQLLKEIIQREAINLPNIVKAIDGEQQIFDPLHRGNWFRDKRAKRTPDGLTNEEYLAQVKEVYPQSADLIDKIEQIKPGEWTTETTMLREWTIDIGRCPNMPGGSGTGDGSDASWRTWQVLDTAEGAQATAAAEYEQLRRESDRDDLAYGVSPTRE